MLQLWRVTFKRLAYIEKDRDIHSKVFACKSRSQIDAMAFARANIFNTVWWDQYMVTDLQPCGELWACEGFKVPFDDD